MKRILLVAVIAICLLTAFKNVTVIPIEGNTRFKEFIDQETGVHYFAYHAMNGTGITVRLNSDGTPYTGKDSGNDTT